MRSSYTINAKALLHGLAAAALAVLLVAIGIVVGFLVALGLTRVMATLLYDVSANDVSIYAIVMALLGAAALLASYVPARRAMRVDPMVALRYE